MDANLSFIAVRGFDIIHDVDMDIIQDDAGLRHVRPFPKNRAEDDAGFRGGYLGRM
jgi:hypothetical protein